MALRQNIGSLLTIAAKRVPNRVALIWRDQEWTYNQLNFRANSLANGLKQIGAKKGDIITIMGNNCNQFVETSLAAYKIGAIAVPFDPRLVPEEVAYLVQDSGAKFLFFEDFAQAHAEESLKISSKLEHCICWGEKVLPGKIAYEGLLKKYQTEECQDVEVDENDVAWVGYTSGTTGRPKGAMLTHGVLKELILGELTDVCPANDDTVCLHVGSLSHGAWSVFLPMLAKACLNVIYPEKSLDIELFCQCIEKYRVTTMFVVPTMIKLLIDSPYVDQYDLSSLQYVVYGGSPMYVEDMKKALAKLGPVFVQIFGQFETPNTGTFLPRQEHILNGTPEQMKRLGSAGFPRTGIEIKIVDKNDKTLSTGETGEICVRGDTMMKGYLNRPKETKQTLRGGWVHTGDIGYLDQDEYLYIMDRSKDMYISGGLNIYPRETEEILLQHPEVREGCVLGVPDEKWGETGMAVIVLKPGSRVVESDIIEFLKPRMAGYKRPRLVEFVDELPKSGYGKILKRELRERYWKGKGKMVQ